MYGQTHHGKQRYQYKYCQRQFVERNDHWIDERTRTYIERLLRERISLRAICRAMQVGMTCLMDFAASIWEQTPTDRGVDWELFEYSTEEELQGVELQVNEMWSFVGRKKNERWIWMIYCPAIKQVLAFHVGARGKVDAKRLLNKLPARLRENCSSATDYREAYHQTVPRERHRASKALTYYIEGYLAGVCARVRR